MTSVRLIHFCPWAGRLVEAETFLGEAGAIDLNARISRPGDAELLRMARLDCDWHAENVRAFAAARREGLELLPAWTFGAPGAADLLGRAKPPGEEWWVVITGQHPQHLGGAAGRFFQGCARRGIRVLFYAFDEASRTMPCFSDIAPHLDILIHDESPLDAPGASRLKPECVRIHRSWVANLVPFAAPFVADPEPRIVFMGSKLGLTPHRRRQIDFLSRRYGERFVAICDHSLPVGERLSLSRFKVSVCPEGRKFAAPAMAATHTDRPFWSGCLGMVPVSEDSRAGGRLEALANSGLILRYRHGDLEDLASQCDRALALAPAARRTLYDHFNAHETVGTVVTEAIAASRPALQGATGQRIPSLVSTDGL